MTTSTTRIGLAGLIASAAAIALLVPAAQATTSSCTNLVPGALVVSIDGTSTLSVNGSAIEADGIPCDTATTDNIDSITVTGDAGDDTLTIDLSGGAFAPGATDEGDGSSEIEFDVDLGAGSGDSLVVNGSADNDVIVAGQSDAPADQINLNEEFDGVDADVTLANIEAVTLAGGEGEDHLLGGGYGPSSNFSAVLPAPFGLPLTIDGGDADDDLQGGAGDDVLDGGTDVDFVDDEGDIYFTLTDTQLSGNGTDSLADIERASLHGGPNGNILDATGFTGSASLSGEGGADTLIGGSGPDALNGGDGIDSLDGGDGADNLSGEDGGNTLDGGDGLDTVSEAGDFPLYTLTEDTLITIDVVDGLTNIETAFLGGGPGANAFDVGGWTGSGGGTIQGQGGEDTLIWSGDPDSVSLSDSSLEVTVGADFTLFGDIEQANLTGGTGDNVFGVSNWTGSATFDGGDGSDTFSASQDGDFVLTGAQVSISNGATVSLTGFETTQVAGGDAGNVFDVGGWTATGSNSIDGLDGTDTVVAARNANITLSDALLNVGGTTFSLDAIEAGVLGGGPGNNTLNASAFSGEATVSYAAATGPVKPNLTRGLSTGAGKDTLIGFDNVFGSPFADVIDGDAGSNTLEGGGGNDRINGSQGADALVGGPGTDSDTGGKGVDSCLGEKFNGCETTGAG